MAYTAGITEQKDLLKIQGVAEDAIEVYRIVTGGTAADGVVSATSTAVYPLGISGDAGENGKSSYASGDPVAIRYSGISYLKMSGTGSRFALVIATTGGAGKARKAETGWCVGVATKDWSDGEIIPVIIHQVYIEGAGS